jgi:hypothetical protein
MKIEYKYNNKYIKLVLRNMKIIVIKSKENMNINQINKK